MALATISGGENVLITLNPVEVPFAKDALAALSAGFTNGEVLGRNEAPVNDANTLNVYNFPGGPPPFFLPSNAQGVVLVGGQDPVVVGHGGLEVLIGDQNNNTFYGAGGHGTIIAGHGANRIYSDGGSFAILTGKGQDTVNLFNGGSDTVFSLGHDTVKVAAANLTMSGKGTVFGLGNDTVSFVGGSPVLFDGTRSVAAESVQAGSGRTTMLAGHGTNFFAGGNGFSLMDAKGAASAVFSFDSSQAGGFHKITHFSHGPDKLHITGNGSTADILNNHTFVHGGSTVISLDHGATVIVLKGFTGLNSTDFS